LLEGRLTQANHVKVGVREERANLAILGVEELNTAWKTSISVVAAHDDDFFVINRGHRRHVSRGTLFGGVISDQLEFG